MRVAILGAGNIGLATAALLAHSGHVVTVWSPSGRGTAALAAGELVCTGAVNARVKVAVAASAGAALEGAEAAFLCAPAYAHPAIIAAAVPHLRAAQTVVIMPAGPLSPLLLAGRCKPVGLATTVMTARRGAGAEVNIPTIRDRLDLAALPARDSAAARTLLQALFGDRFGLQDNLLGIALSNVNPVVHVPLMLGNLSRVDRAERWPQYDNLTPSVAAMIEAVDAERLAVARAFGLAVPSVEDHFARSFGVPHGRLADMAAAVHAQRGGPPGPVALEDRYLVEDIPYGLAFYATLARIAGVGAPVTAACIALAEAALGRPLAADNRVAAALGLERMHRAALLAAVA
ncbi:MAG: NAD/NADP octopine/nopaline dehydrogenase family protein [Burkholderiales bacterium]